MATSISTTIKTIQDIMRKDVGIDGDAQRIGQLAWMIFLKVIDDQRQDYILQGNELQWPIPEQIAWHEWANDQKRMDDDELIKFINNELLPGMKNISVGEGIHPIGVVIRSLFEGVYNYMKSGSLMRQVINKINESLDFKNSKDRHIVGDIYEKILGDLQSAGNAGEFYTPRPVTEFMIRMIGPKIGEKVLDPACGTGGFLISVINYIRSNFAESSSQVDPMPLSLVGVEKKPLPHLLATTNLLLHGIDVPSEIIHGNLLLQPLTSSVNEGLFDVIVTNPPFGGSEEDGVAKNFSEEFRSKETADLFLVLIIDLLKQDGRAAVVLPDGFLFGEGIKTRIKRKLLEECNLHTIVRLPKGVFSPYTDITTNLLFFTKGKPTTDVWYIEHPYPTGYKSYSKTKPIQTHEFNLECDWWKIRQETEHAWKVSIEEIKDRNYNLDIKNPHDRRSHIVPPDELLSQYQQLHQEVTHYQDTLKQQLSDILETRSDQSTDILLAHLQMFTQIPLGFAKLRELILCLAVQGRLVHQDLTDEPASVLLNKLQARKQELEQQGVIRQTAPFSPLEPNKVPFSIPDTWCWVRLGDITQIVGGGTPDTKHQEHFSDNGIAWLTPADLYQLEGKYIERGKRDLSELGLQKSSARLLPKGSVLFSSRAPIGYVAIAANELATNQGFKSCVPFCMEMNEFIYYYLIHAAKEVERNAPGTTFKEVSGKLVQQIPFPLPPLLEQKRIVAKVDQLMAIIRHLEANYKSLAAIRERLASSTIEHVLAN